MPIKVSYTDEKGNPIEDAQSTDITNEDRIAWNKMRYEGFKRGIYEDDLETPKGKKLMKEFDIEPEKIDAYREDMIKKAEEQSAPGALPEVEPGFSSMYLYVKPEILAQARTPRMGYVTYVAQRGDKPAEDYGTDIKKFMAEQNVAQAARDNEWSSFGDPTKDVNYVTPGTQSGFNSPSANTEMAPNAGFPTRDPKTGRVTPAVIAQPITQEENEQ